MVISRAELTFELMHDIKYQINMIGALPLAHCHWRKVAGRSLIMTGIVEIVMETPCYQCQRLARYTAFHRADEALLVRLRQPISPHDIAAILEARHE